MNSIPDDSTFTLPLTRQVHQMAEQFRQQQSDRHKAKQVYLNTLAVQAVAHYLAWFGIETDLSNSQSWQPLYQQLADVADLQICQAGQPQGKLECRPVLPQAQVGYVPPEVWSDRLGYVFVQFDEQLTEATLLGFVPTVQQTELPLQTLRSIDDLFDYLSPAAATINNALPNNASPNNASPVTHLSQWLHQVVDTSWQTVESLLQQGFNQTQQWLDSVGNPLNSSLNSILNPTLNPTVPALSFRGDPTDRSIVVNRGKLLNLSDQSTAIPVILLVAIQPLSDRDLGDRDLSDRDLSDRDLSDRDLGDRDSGDQKTTGVDGDRQAVDIWVRLCPAAGQTHLPPHLDLLILDSEGTAVMQAQSRTTEMMQLRFGGETGEQFSIQIVLGSTRVTEMFII